MAEIAANPEQSPVTGPRLTGPRRLALHYGLTVLALALGLTVRIVGESVLSGQPAYLVYVPAILIGSALGGWGPGVLATASGLVLGLYFVELARPLTGLDGIGAALFVLIGLGATWRGQLLDRARHVALQGADAALGREVHLQSILATVPDAMVVIDERGVIQSFSSAAERLFGYS